MPAARSSQVDSIASLCYRSQVRRASVRPRAITERVEAALALGCAGGLRGGHYAVRYADTTRPAGGSWQAVSCVPAPRGPVSTVLYALFAHTDMHPGLHVGK